MQKHLEQPELPKTNIQKFTLESPFSTDKKIHCQREERDLGVSAQYELPNGQGLLKVSFLGDGLSSGLANNHIFAAAADNESPAKNIADMFYAAYLSIRKPGNTPQQNSLMAMQTLLDKLNDILLLNGANKKYYYASTLVASITFEPAAEEAEHSCTTVFNWGDSIIYQQSELTGYPRRLNYEHNFYFVTVVERGIQELIGANTELLSKLKEDPKFSSKLYKFIKLYLQEVIDLYNLKIIELQAETEKDIAAAISAFGFFDVKAAFKLCSNLNDEVTLFLKPFLENIRIPGYGVIDLSNLMEVFTLNVSFDADNQPMINYGYMDNRHIVSGDHILDINGKFQSDRAIGNLYHHSFLHKKGSDTQLLLMSDGYENLSPGHIMTGLQLGEDVLYQMAKSSKDDDSVLHVQGTPESQLSVSEIKQALTKLDSLLNFAANIQQFVSILIGYGVTYLQLEDLEGNISIIPTRILELVTLRSANLLQGLAYGKDVRLKKAVAYANIDGEEIRVEVALQFHLLNLLTADQA